MIIDQLTPTLSDNLTDEIPVEQGTVTLKTTWQKALNLFLSNTKATSGTPEMDGIATLGTANTFSQSDHVHPTDTSRAAADNVIRLDGQSVSVWEGNTYDLNNLSTGIVFANYQVLNVPEYLSITTDWLVVAGGGNNSKMQLAVNGLANGAVYVRKLYNSSWLSWHKLSSDPAIYLTSVTCSATTGDFVDLSNANITEDHVVVYCEFANPAAITSDWTWTTAAGSLKLNGTCATATTADIALVKK